MVLTRREEGRYVFYEHDTSTRPIARPYIKDEVIPMTREPHPDMEVISSSAELDSLSLYPHDAFSKAKLAELSCRVKVGLVQSDGTARWFAYRTAGGQYTDLSLSPIDVASVGIGMQIALDEPHLDTPGRLVCQFDADVPVDVRLRIVLQFRYLKD